MKKIISKITVFLVLFCCMAGILSDLLQQKWNYAGNNAATSIAKGFYEEERGSLDILYLGMSVMRNGISPLEIWNGYGITGYSRSGSVQSAMVSYYILQESLRTQLPRAVVVEVGAFTDMAGIEANDYTYNEGKIHENIDMMKLSSIKLAMAAQIAKESDLSMASLLSPLYRYHDRWESIEKQDFIYREWQQDYVYKGQYPALTTYRYHFPDTYMQEGIVCELDSRAVAYLERINELCREKGIDLILLKMPSGIWNMTYHDLVAGYAERFGCSFLDYNMPELRRATGFNAATDFIDGGTHLNISGAEKISLHFGQYLADTYPLKDKRSLEEYEGWNTAYEKYEREKAAFRMANTTDILEYLDELQREGYLVMITARYDTATYFTERLYSKWQELGLQENLAEDMYSSYAAILNDGRAVYEKRDTGNRAVTYYSNEFGIGIMLTSKCSFSQENISSILIEEEEYSPNRVGLNFVVYDKILKRVVNTKSFNIGKAGSDNIDISGKISRIKGYSEDENYLILAAECHDEEGGVIREDVLDTIGLSMYEEEYMCSYIAVLCGGETLYAEMGESNGMTDAGLRLEDRDIFLRSDCTGSGSASIRIDGEEYAGDGSGLSVVIYDKEQKRVVDREVL